MCSRSHDCLILADGFQPDYVRDLSNALARVGAHVTVVGGDIHERESQVEGVRIVNLRGDDSSGRLFVRKVWDMLTYQVRCAVFVARSPCRTVYHVGMGKPWLDRVIVNALFRAIGKHVVHTVHDIVPHDRVTALDLLEHKLIYRLIANRLVVHTRYLRRRLVEEFRVEPRRIVVAPHGTYRPRTRDAVTREGARAALGIRRSDRVLLCFGWQRPYKGTHFLLETLARDWPDDLVVAVEGQAHRQYADLLRRIVAERGLTEKVRLDFGFVTQDRLEMWFKACDIVPLPYFEGSQSGVLFMAYAFGRPVLAARIGGFPESVVCGLSGETFATGDADDLRAALDRLLADPSRYDEDSIKRYARENLSWENCAGP